MNGADELARLVRIYLPPAPARQLIGDLMRSKVANQDPHFAGLMQAVYDALGRDVTGSAADYGLRAIDNN